MPTPPTEREFAIDVVRRLRDAGHEALWAGGCVRDECLGLVPHDYDVATAARPEQVQRVFKRTVGVGVSFGVVEVLGPRPLKVQVATFRSDTSYTDGRRPDAVVFCSAREDALRRDFTINGMFFDPLANQLIDFVGGQQDLRDNVLRAIGDPLQRFTEDKLRMLRAVRIATRFNLRLDTATADAIKTMAPEIRVVSAERLAEELRKLLVDPRRAAGMRLFVDLGLADAVVPELPRLRGTPHALASDQWERILLVLDRLGPRPSVPLAFAALFLALGRRIAGAICLRLKLSNDERERIEWLVEKHECLTNARQLRPSTLKETLNRPGARELLALHRANAAASGKSVDHVEFCEQLLRDWSPADLDPPPLLTGHDLADLGLAPGPQFKRLLHAVREAQLDGTIQSTSDALALVIRLLTHTGVPDTQKA